MTNKHNLHAPVIDLLSVTAGRNHGAPSGESDPCCILAFRLATQQFRPVQLVVTQQQAVRLRNDISKLLDDPESWLYFENDSGHVQDAPTGFDNPVCVFNSPLDPDEAA